MSKFLLITKINLLSFFNIKRITNSKFKSERKKNAYKALILIGIILYFAYYVYEMFKFMLPGFVLMNKPLYALGYLFSLLSLFILLSNIFRVKSILFDYKDYDLLNSLPIKRRTIIFSKLTSFYLLNLFYTFLVMIPAFYAYQKYIGGSFGLLYFILLFIIPIVPLVISCILGIILSWLTSFFKNKNFGSYIINISIIVFVLFINFNMGGMDEISMATNGIDMVNKMHSIYPLTNVFVELLNNFSIGNLLVFITVPTVFILLFIYIINNYYYTIRTRLLKTNINVNYEVNKYRSYSPLVSLYKKEIKKFFSNSMYVINTTFGCILLIVLVLSIILFKSDTIAKLMSIDNFSEVLKQNIFMIISLCCTLSCTTHPAISLEGKSLWIMKAIPVNYDVIMLSKVMVNLTILLPTILISSTFFGIYLHFGLVEFIMLYLMPIAYSVFIALMGLLFNLMFPRFDFDNEIKVIKQSIPAFLTIFVGMISVIIPFAVMENNYNGSILITMLVILVDIVLMITLHFYGAKKMARL